MAIDTVAEFDLEQPRQPRPDRVRSDSARRGRWRRGLLAIGAIGVLASVAALFLLASSPREIGAVVTHTITRGDLRVTVTEQGTLESSDNTDIKCKVRGTSTVIWVIEGGTEVRPGDELVRLDSLALEEQISERIKYAHLARSVAERSRADVARAELAIAEYEQGRYVAQLATLQKDMAIAESQLRTARNMLAHAERMFESGYVSELDVEEKEFAVTRANLNVEYKKTEIDVLKRFTRSMELETLKGDLKAARAQYAADKERSFADALRRDRALEELQYCVMKAERSGIVIHPSAAAWRNVPQIEEGATVHKDQVLLLMPDLSKMQVKVGIHESVIERIKPGLAARITLPGKTLEGEVFSVASVTRPAGWWTGNVVKYDTIIRLPPTEGLKPGMTAEVEVLMARHEDVLMIPITAVVETDKGYFCWLNTADGIRRRALRLGDSNDMFVVVDAGLKEGDEVVLDPLAFVEEAQAEAAKTLDKTKSRRSKATESDTKARPPVTLEIDHVD